MVLASSATPSSSRAAMRAGRSSASFAPAPPPAPLLSGFPGPLVFAWIRLDTDQPILPNKPASLRIRGYRTTNKGVSSKPSFDRTWTFAAYGLTADGIFNLVTKTLDEDPLDFMCKRHAYDDTILLVQLPSFSIQIDGVFA